MGLSWLQSLLYGLISGLTEIFPVSAQAHQALVMQLFGRSQREPLRDLFVHIALIAALLTAARSLFQKVRGVRGISAHAGSSHTMIPCGCICRALQVHFWLTPPSTEAASARALL